MAGRARRTLGDCEGCAATGALEVRAARTCFGAAPVGAAGAGVVGAAAGLTAAPAEGDGTAAVTAGCAMEGFGMGALLSLGPGVETAG